MAGGLTSYSGSIIEAYRLAGADTGRVLKGDKPIDPACPAGHQSRAIHQFEDSQGARDHTVPLPLSGRADELFE